MDIKPKHKGSCHCGAVHFEVTLPKGLEELRRCNCSMCRRRGSIAASVELADLFVELADPSVELFDSGGQWLQQLVELTGENPPVGAKRRYVEYIVAKDAFDERRACFVYPEMPTRAISNIMQG